MAELLALIPHLSGLITVGLMWQVWNIKRSFDDTRDTTSTNRKGIGQMQSKLDDLQRDIATLLEDHKEIKRQQEDIMEFARKLDTQHRDQDVEMAKMMKDLDEIKRKLEAKQ